jgi:hypothetical protein
MLLLPAILLSMLNNAKFFQFQKKRVVLVDLPHFLFAGNIYLKFEPPVAGTEDGKGLNC